MSDANATINEILDNHARLSRARLAEEAGYLAEEARSPIERIFGVALLSALSRIEELTTFDVKCSADQEPEENGAENFVVSQAIFNNGRYCVSFLIQMGLSKKLVIECNDDECTKEQVASNRRRDRWFQSKGIAVLRFSGSEIWRDPIDCAEQVIDTIYRVFFL